MKTARIEIIPMIDAIFFLLVFFMFSSLSMVKMKGVNVDVPRAAPSGGTAAKSTSSAQSGTSSRVVVTVTPEGLYFLNKNKSGRESLGRDLQKRIATSPGAVVVVNVAKSQNTQNLINVMDAVKSIETPAGEPLQVLIATEPVDLDGLALPASRSKK